MKMKDKYNKKIITVTKKIIHFIYITMTLFNNV